MSAWKIVGTTFSEKRPIAPSSKTHLPKKLHLTHKSLNRCLFMDYEVNLWHRTLIYKNKHINAKTNSIHYQFGDLELLD